VKTRTVEQVSEALHDVGRDIEAAECRLSQLYARRVELYTEGHLKLGMTYDSIAQATGVSFGSVAQALRKIKKGSNGA